MNKFDYTTRSYGSVSKTGYDEGLRQYFLKIYTLMSIALAITSFAIFSIPASNSLNV